MLCSVYRVWKHVDSREVTDLHQVKIDEVILLLDYIDSLKQDESKIEEINSMIDRLTMKMDYIEKLEVLFKDDMYLDFLHLRNWPRTF